MRKIIVTALLVLVPLISSGCTKSNVQSNDLTQGATVETTSCVLIQGATSVVDFITEEATAFMEQNKNITVDYQGTGNDSGLAGLAEEMSQMALATRKLSSEEEGKGLKATVIAYQSVAVVVNPLNTINDLSPEQITSLFKGSVGNWKNVGGQDSPIKLVVLKQGGIRDAFENVFSTKVDENGMIKSAIPENVQSFDSTEEVCNAVEADPQTIGFVSLSQIRDAVKVLTISGVEAKTENVKVGSYIWGEPVILATKGEPTDRSKKLIEFILSEAGQKIALDNGLVTVK